MLGRVLMAYDLLYGVVGVRVLACWRLWLVLSCLGLAVSCFLLPIVIGGCCGWFPVL